MKKIFTIWICLLMFSITFSCGCLDYFDTDWDSLADFEEFLKKFISEPEMMALTEKWEPIVASHEMEFYTVIEKL